MLKLLQEVWEFDPGNVPGTSRTLGIISATSGLGVAEIVSATIYLHSQGYFGGVALWLQTVELGWTELKAIGFVTILVLLIACVTILFGTVVFLSSEGRSYIGYAWQGAVVVIGAIVLVTITRRITFLFDLVG